MITSDWIAISSIPAGLLSTTIGRVLLPFVQDRWHYEKVTSVDKTFEKVVDRVDRARLEMTGMQVKTRKSCGDTTYLNRTSL